ncbi:hypothetical protein [Verrucomicrobium sp. BvORR034]|uniref:hypothetical protein n=1 Tax=Verrucomicrobium sp. BvORR034 TaxID=1396418 RepID=UPI002240FF41|nr:hypothetical protein [Verrucomicrobium sp. BvORR034]
MTPSENSQPIAMCQACGCRENDCSQRIERSGEPCHWAAPGLCSACLQLAQQVTKDMQHHVLYDMGVTRDVPPPLDGYSIELMIGAQGILQLHAECSPALNELGENAGRVIPITVCQRLATALYTMTHYADVFPDGEDQSLICRTEKVALIICKIPEERRIITL